MSHLHCDIEGEGPPLVLLHGWGMNSCVWQPVLTQLSREYRLFLVDLPGFGYSQTGTDEYSLAAIADAVLTVVPETADWLGWSMGGLVATYIAATFPERVTRLVNVASNPCFIQNSTWPGMDLAVLQHFSGLLQEDYPATLQRFLALQVLASPHAQALLRELKQLLAQAPAPSTDALVAGLQLLQQTDLRWQIAQLTCPLLYILGKLDALVPRALANSLLVLNQNCSIEIIAGACHMPFLSHAELFNQAVITFLKKPL